MNEYVYTHRLDASNIFEFSLKWQKNKGLDPDLNSEYLAKMSEKLTAALEATISDSAKFIQEHTGSAVYQEVLCHGTYCKEKAKDFLVLNDITKGHGFVFEFERFIRLVSFPVSTPQFFFSTHSKIWNEVIIRPGCWVMMMNK